VTNDPKTWSGKERTLAVRNRARPFGGAYIGSFVVTEKGGVIAANPTLHVAVIEDNDMITRLVTQMLDLDPDVVVTSGGADVKKLMEEAFWRDIDVALVDLLLPGMTGDELLTWLAAHAPHVRRIAMSGSGALRLEQVTNADVKLLKPFSLDAVLEAVRPSGSK
jgi:DNA-binding NtrC family response regulator